MFGAGLENGLNGVPYPHEMSLECRQIQNRNLALTPIGNNVA